MPFTRSNAKLISRLTVRKGDITQQRDVDAIVASIRADLRIQGTLNQALIAAAGKDFDEFILNNVYKPRPGDAFAVPGFALPVESVIFVVTPSWKDDFGREDVHLLRCYRHAIKAAQRMGMKKIAFPALGTGHERYPVERAARLAVQGVMDRIGDDITEVRFVCYTDKTYHAFAERLKKMGGQG